jgi:hypothetical protein
LNGDAAMEIKVVNISMWETDKTLTKFIKDMHSDGWEFMSATAEFMFFKKTEKKRAKKDE